MWSDNSVFYQIYPLGALGCPFENDGIKAHRILKVKEWSDHLLNLGIDAILFNPVFLAKTHGYDTTDYYHLDNRLGDDADFADVVDHYHRLGIRIIIDAVFNHVGRSFFAFEDVLSRRENSPYRYWFKVDFSGNNRYNDHLSYENWEGNDNLVKLNLQNEEVITYLLNVTDYWRQTFKIDGLRLDVAYCLDENFLRRLHDHTKAADHQFFLLGETLHGDYNRWMNEAMLDTCTNYECYKGLFSSFNSYNLFEILYAFNRQSGKENWCLYRGKRLFNFVDNHDVTRIASNLTNEHHLPLIYVMLMTMVGIPCIYYGSEWGMKGEKNWNDSDLRKAVDKMEDNDLTAFISHLIKIKHSHPALNDTYYEQKALTNTACVYERKSADEVLWIAINIKDEPVTLNVNIQAAAVDLLSEKPVDIAGSITLKPYQAMILKA